MATPSDKRPRNSPVVKTLTDKELRKHAIQLAADAIVLARMAERAYARAEKKKGSGKRKALVAVGAIVAALGLAKATKSLLKRS
jgi:hypothetical protein